jgi:hypothetical protein
MQKIAFVVLALITLPVVAAENTTWPMVRAEAIRGHVEFLANDLLEGRAAATRGYDIAAAYVATQFRQCGLKPAGTESSFYQTVPLLEATPVLPGSAAKLVAEGDDVEFEYGTDYLPSADFLSASSTLSAPLAFAGYGIEAPELSYNDFQAVDVNGRIAVIFSGAPEQFPHDQRAYYSWSAMKFSTLIAHGAVGAVLIDSPVDARRIPWERSVAMSWTPQMRWLDEIGKPHQAFEEIKLRFRFNQTSAARLFERSEKNFEAVLASAAAGESQGFQLPGLLTLEATTGLRRTESANVIATLPGSDPQLKNQYVVISAHLDHLGRGAAVNGDSVYNGAHDNALGVGILLEMARAVRMSGVRPRRSLIFAAVTAEEKGLLGSDYFVQHLPMKDGELVANINIDMPMLFTATRDFVALGAEHTSLGTNARAAAASQGYRLSPNATPEEVGFIRSDQFSFIRQGIPALLLHGGYEARDPAINARQLQQEFRQLYYHQPSDDTSLPMDFAAAADLARLNLSIAMELANASARPRWKTGDFFGKQFAQRPHPQ